MEVLFWTQLLAASEWAIRLTMLPIIVLRKEKPEACLAWLALVFFEPWIGLALYLLIGENRLGRRRLADRQQRRLLWSVCNGKNDPERDLSSERFASLDDLFGRLEGLPMVGGNQLILMSDTDTVIDRLIADIDAAQHHVHLLFYIFKDDEVGRRVGEALIRATGRGVICRVLADAVGSRKLFRRLAPSLRRAGVRILPALPATLWRLPFARLDLRNHRKLAVIDGRIAYTGSQNIVEATYGHKRAGAWHDLMARLTGPVVHQLQGIFLEDWFYESGELLEDPALFPACPQDGSVVIQVVPTGPDQPTELFQDLLVRAIFFAKRQVVITSPYFIPNESMLLALRLAALRKVHVELALPRRSDHPLVAAAGGFYCRHLMRHGVRVFLFGEGMLHAKTLTIDDELAMFGSANYDIRSFDLNFELNLVLYSSEAVREVRRLQQNYIARSQEARLEDWPAPTFGSRLKVNLAKLFSPLL